MQLRCNKVNAATFSPEDFREKFLSNIKMIHPYSIMRKQKPFGAAIFEIVPTGTTKIETYLAKKLTGITFADLRKVIMLAQQNSKILASQSITIAGHHPT